MEDLLFTLNAVLPIILVIVLGYVLKRMHFFDDKFLKTANKLCFKVCIPVLLFYNVYNISSLSDINLKFVLFIIIGILALFFVGLAIVMLFVKDKRQKGVILQCAFRSNYAIIGLPIVTQLCNADPSAVAVASLVSAFSIPLFNILAVVSLSIFSNDENYKPDFKKILIDICKNPLIIGVVSGLVVFGIRMLFVEIGWSFTIKDNLSFVYTTISYIQRIATPLSLIVLGGQFSFQAIGRLKKQIILGTTIRTIMVPAVFLTIAYFLGFGEVEIPTLIALFGTPVAVSSVVMAQQMGSDEELAGQLVIWTTIVSALSLFIIILVFRNLGFFA